MFYLTSFKCVCHPFYIVGSDQCVSGVWHETELSRGVEGSIFGVCRVFGVCAYFCLGCEVFAHTFVDL